MDATRASVRYIYKGLYSVGEHRLRHTRSIRMILDSRVSDNYGRHRSYEVRLSGPVIAGMEGVGETRLFARNGKTSTRQRTFCPTAPAEVQGNRRQSVEHANGSRGLAWAARHRGISSSDIHPDRECHVGTLMHASNPAHRLVQRPRHLEHL